MKFVHSKTVSPFLMQSLLGLWNTEYPTATKHYLNTLADYLNKLKDLKHTFVLDDVGNLVGWYYDFQRNRERQFAIIISSSVKGQGHGTSLLNKAKQKHDSLFGWIVDSDDNLKLNGERYQSPLNFYLKNGFKTEPIRWDSEKIKTVKISWHK